MKIWLDLANSPQVIFFRPILAELLKRGNVVEITTRAYAQTVQLTSKFGWSHTVVGHHGGRGFFELARQNYFRSLDLVHWAKSRHFDLAVSHNSYSQSVAAALLRIPFVTLMDYEHQPLNHLCFRLACRVIVPEVFPHKYLRWYGAVKKRRHFPGLKSRFIWQTLCRNPILERERVSQRTCH